MVTTGQGPTGRIITGASGGPRNGWTYPLPFSPSSSSSTHCKFLSSCGTGDKPRASRLGSALPLSCFPAHGVLKQGSHSIAQAGLKLLILNLLSTRTAHTYHYTWLSVTFTLLLLPPMQCLTSAPCCPSGDGRSWQAFCVAEGRTVCAMSVLVK